MKKKRILETKELIEQALFEYYFEKGQDVPNWRMQKDPDWWTNYLRELSGDHEENDDW